MSRKRFTIQFSDGSKKHVGSKIRDELLAANQIRLVGGLIYRSCVSHPKISISDFRFTNYVVSTYDPGNRVHGWVQSHIRQSRVDNAPGVHTQEQWIERVKYFG